MKKVVMNTTLKENNFPRYLTIGHTEITEESLIAKNLNNLFVKQVRNQPPLFQTVEKQYK